MKRDDELALAVAMAIHGPHDAMAKGSRYTLNELRSMRWSFLNSQQQSYLLRKAEAAIAQTQSKARNGEGDLLAVGLE